MRAVPSTNVNIGSCVRDADSCSTKRIVDQFRAAGNDLNALPAALIGTDAFLYRRPVDEVLP